MNSLKNVVLVVDAGDVDLYCILVECLQPSFCYDTSVGTHGIAVDSIEQNMRSGRHIVCFIEIRNEEKRERATKRLSGPVSDLLASNA